MDSPLPLIIFAGGVLVAVIAVMLACAGGVVLLAAAGVNTIVKLIREILRSPRIDIRHLIVLVVATAVAATIGREVESTGGKLLSMTAFFGMLVAVCVVEMFNGEARVRAARLSSRAPRHRVWRVYRRESLIHRQRTTTHGRQSVGLGGYTDASSGTSANDSYAPRMSLRVSSQPVQASVMETP